MSAFSPGIGPRCQESSPHVFGSFFLLLRSHQSSDYKIDGVVNRVPHTIGQRIGRAYRYHYV